MLGIDPYDIKMSKYTFSDEDVAKVHLICLDDKDLSLESAVAKGILFNPDKVTLSRNANWGAGDSPAKEDKKKPYATLAFSGGKNDTLKFTLKLDASESDADLYRPLSKIYALREESPAHRPSNWWLVVFCRPDSSQPAPSTPARM